MRSKSSRRVILSGVLALVLPVLVVLAEVPVLHAHQGEGLGLYDGECPSWRLATSAGGLGPSPRPLAGLGRPLLREGSRDAQRPLTVCGACRAPTDARAPPRPA